MGRFGGLLFLALLGLLAHFADANAYMRLIHTNGKICEADANKGSSDKVNCPYRASLSTVHIRYNKDNYCDQKASVSHRDLRNGNKWFVLFQGSLRPLIFESAGILRAKRSVFGTLSTRTIPTKRTEVTTSIPTTNVTRHKPANAP